MQTKEWLCAAFQHFREFHNERIKSHVPRTRLREFHITRAKAAPCGKGKKTTCIK